MGALLEEETSGWTGVEKTFTYVWLFSGDSKKSPLIEEGWSGILGVVLALKGGRLYTWTCHCIPL